MLTVLRRASRRQALTDRHEHRTVPRAEAVQQGAGTWVLATVIVWLGTLLAGVILVRVFLDERRDAR